MKNFLKIHTGESNFIYAPSGKHGFDQSHCHKPTPFKISDEVIRVYFGTRDKKNITRTSYVDLCTNDIRKILFIKNSAVLDVGKIGTFDDSGANVCSVIKVDNEIFMYYIGWNPSTTVHTRNSIGLVKSTDGENFEREWDGSILDRDRLEPYYTGAVEVMAQDNKFIMWYTSGSEWKIIEGKPEIFYHIKYAESFDGIEWNKHNKVCIPPAHDYEATARPSVILVNGIYMMLYSKRDLRGFRNDKSKGYRAGFAFSTDGIKWNRADHLLDFEPSKSYWDGETISYPVFHQQNDRTFIFYNGNGFGKTGFGAVEINLGDLLDIVNREILGNT